MAVRYRLLAAAPYGAEVHLYTGPLVTVLPRIMQDLQVVVEAPPPSVNGFTQVLAPGTLLVWVAERGKIGVLCHELLHATFAVLRWVGVRLSSGSEEAFTYLFDHLLRQALR